VLLNGVAVITELSLERDNQVQQHPQQRTIDGLQVMQYLTLVVFLFEVVLGCVVWAPHRYWAMSHFNKLDVLVSIGSVIVLVTDWARNEDH